MAFENFPTAESAPPTSPQPKKSDWRTFLSIGLVIALLGTWGYIIWDKSKTKEVLQQKDSQLFSVRTEKDTLQSLLDEATNRYDQLKTTNAKKDSTITRRDREIAEKKSRIQSLLSKANVTEADLAAARRMIAGKRTASTREAYAGCLSVHLGLAERRPVRQVNANSPHLLAESRPMAVAAPEPETSFTPYVADNSRMSSRPDQRRCG